jgi:hypothetical protein
MAETKGSASGKVDISLMRHMILNTLRSYRSKYSNRFGELVIACDSRSYWRKTHFPHYKAGRKKAREEGGVDWASLFESLNTVREELRMYFPYPVVEVPDAEADDVIAALAIWSQENDLVDTEGLFSVRKPKDFLVVSGDHDFLQLQRYPNVKQYSPKDKKVLTIEEPADHILMEHIISGDKGDGIPNMFSDADTFVTNKRQKSVYKADLARWKTGDPSAFCTSDALKTNFERNRQLIDLRLTPDNVRDNIIATYQSQTGVNSRGRGKIIDYFMEHRMRLMLDVVTDF